ncbi:heat-inducible transcription repressor HrcA [Hoeflea marina]|uniref:Heat-inducible transcription repressor HrcA n=1 Tax=Hoeflea marina TaxID=274592 RepID=A0A317PKA8_9HYPH|nr:heat-inducible transcriptional repressor HrcA [Hoeflea marina]PWW00095.1 heat-inducible transcription repressor HrcA [Hoeflea marina]
MTINNPLAVDLLSTLDERSREIFRSIVESYLESGDPLGSRSLSRLLPVALSPASIRNVMSDLEGLGLIYAPHVSAGRLPTQKGLRFFVDAFMQVGDLQPEMRESIERQVRTDELNRPVETLLTEASQMLSGMSRGAGLVIAAKNESTIRHIEFIRLDPQRALVVLVGGNDQVENRIMELPAGVTASQLTEAANFLNAHLAGRTMDEVRKELERQHGEVRSALDALSRDLVERGLAAWAGASSASGSTRMIVRGRANLLENVSAGEDLDRLRLLFDELERNESLIELMSLADAGSGVRIFIGSENKLFSLSGSSVIVAPYRDGEDKVIGAVGIIGPTRLNYARIVPMVDYTAQLVSRLVRK